MLSTNQITLCNGPSVQLHSLLHNTDLTPFPVSELIIADWARHIENLHWVRSRCHTWKSIFHWFFLDLQTPLLSNANFTQSIHSIHVLALCLTADNYILHLKLFHSPDMPNPSQYAHFYLISQFLHTQFSSALSHTLLNPYMCSSDTWYALHSTFSSLLLPDSIFQPLTAL